jgi:hypothetical protein
MSSAQTLAAKKQEILKSVGFRRLSTPTRPIRHSFLKARKILLPILSGKTTHQSLDALVDALATGAGRDEMVAALDPILRIRAVQTFTPSKATSFVFSLKQIVRQHLPDAGPDAHGDMNDLDRGIDEMAMAAFDIYVACREKIYELKANESRKQFFGSLKRAGLIDRNRGRRARFLKLPL